MLRSVCLNPVIDRMYYINDFVAGKQYPRIAPDVWVAGKGINIARVARQLGEPCALYGFVGGNYGKLVRGDMEQYGVELHLLETKGETRSTINVIDRQSGLETEITEPGVTVGGQEENQILDMLRHDLSAGDLVVCSGIPLSGMRDDIFRDFASICREKHAKCAIDVNHQYLKASFPEQYFFAKPNWAELNDLFDTDLEFTTDNLRVLAAKMKALGVMNLMVSAGGNGGILLTDEGAWQASFRPQQVVSTIGCGDSSVAGYCIATLRGYDSAACLRFSMACGMCNARFSQTGYVDQALVEQLQSEVDIIALDEQVYPKTKRG